MKIHLILLLFIVCCSKSFSQSFVKTYYDPFTKTQLKEVYAVIPGTPTPNGLYRLYDEQGKLAIVGSFLKGDKNGIWKEYNNGVLYIIGTYKHGNKDGVQTMYDNSSGENKVSSITTFKDDYPIKEVDYDRYTNGIIQAEYEVTIVHGGKSRNGFYRAYWGNGVIQEKGNYNYEIKIGLWETFYENGVKESVYEYNSAGKIASLNSWYLTGKPKFQKILDKPRIFKQFEFDSLTNIKKIQSIFEYTDDDYTSILSKTVEFFDPLGKSIEVIKTYSGNSGNIREGTWKEYFDKDWKEVYDTTKATLFRIITYKSDQIIGKVMDYYMNGSLERISELESDTPVERFKRNSNLISYYPNGKTNENITFDNSGSIKSGSIYNNEGKLYKSFEKKSAEGTITKFLITWYDNNEKPLRTKEIVINYTSADSLAEGFKELIN